MAGILEAGLRPGRAERPAGQRMARLLGELSDLEAARRVSGAVQAARGMQPHHSWLVPTPTSIAGIEAPCAWCSGCVRFCSFDAPVGSFQPCACHVEVRFVGPCRWGRFPPKDTQGERSSRRNGMGPECGSLSPPTFPKSEPFSKPRVGHARAMRQVLGYQGLGVNRRTYTMLCFCSTEALRSARRGPPLGAQTGRIVEFDPKLAEIGQLLADAGPSLPDIGRNPPNLGRNRVPIPCAKFGRKWSMFVTNRWTPGQIRSRSSQFRPGSIRCWRGCRPMSGRLGPESAKSCQCSTELGPMSAKGGTRFAKRKPSAAAEVAPER